GEGLGWQFYNGSIRGGGFDEAVGLADPSRKLSGAEDYGTGSVAGLDAEAGAATKIKVTLSTYPLDQIAPLLDEISYFAPQVRGITLAYKVWSKMSFVEGAEEDEHSGKKQTARGFGWR
ncbi:MAG: hypothetical protein ACREAB_02190, partial [Blastocatellia bacterium]